LNGCDANATFTTNKMMMMGMGMGMREGMGIAIRMGISMDEWMEYGIYSYSRLYVMLRIMG